MNMNEIYRLICCVALFVMLCAGTVAGQQSYQYDQYEPEEEPGGYEYDFRKRKLFYPDTVGMRMFDDGILTGERLEAMKFIYAYLPLPDALDYSPDFFLESVDLSLLAKKEMPWGDKVPEREFRHFVLPLRVNNEMLDGSRKVFYEKLKERVKGKSMQEAILEVNHWCHEKVTYRPSDARTSNPLSTLSQAIGRCGEESTFTVAALRAVGIPARQVYTPRWAHTDDNHAWVEAWADGEWHFLGACEPEPRLDLAWFNIPASRGLMMTTNVFGKYDGPEEKIKETEVVTTINVTSNYAPVGVLKVRTFDKNGNPMDNVNVNFCIYNYAEFFPVATKLSDREGYAEVTCGLGDMIVWGEKDGKFGFVKASPEEGKVWDLVLDKGPGYTGEFELEIVPPSVSRALPEVTVEERRENDRRLAAEDEIRNAYCSTFIDGERAEALAAAHGWDKEKVVPLLVKSRGNHKTITDFLESLEPEELDRGITLLQVLSEKDLRDVTMEVLYDNIRFTPPRAPGMDATVYAEALLNPRVENEWLTPYKEYFVNHVDGYEELAGDCPPEFYADLISWKVREENIYNPQNLHISPGSVWKNSKSDRRSKKIMYVAQMRSLGTPARLDPMTGMPQYYSDGDWKDVDIDYDGPVDEDEILVEISDEEEEPREDYEVTGEKSAVRLAFAKGGEIKRPLYYTHFTLQRIDDGKPALLEFEEGSDVEAVSDGLRLMPGQYMALTGQRLSDGSVLAKGEIFLIRDGEEKELTLVMRADEEKVGVIGNLNAENIYLDLAAEREKSLLSTTGRGNYILGIIKANSEPSVHALNDISLRANEFEKNGTKIMLLFEDEGEAERFDSSRFPHLPSTVSFGVDRGGVSMEELRESLCLEGEEWPVFVIADSFNRVMFLSRGYTIGLGDRLLEILEKLN